MSGHVQSEVSNEHCVTPVKMRVLGVKDIEHNVIKREVKEEPGLSECTEGMGTHSFSYVECLKCEELVYNEDIQEAVLEDMLDVESQRLMDDDDMKYEVLEESIDIEEHKLISKDDGQHEESKYAECLKLIESEGAVSNKKYKQPENIEDGYTLTPGRKNILEDQTSHKTVAEESSIKSIGTHMLQTTETVEINTQFTIKTSMHTVISNVIDKYLKNKSNRQSYRQREQRLSATDVVNKQIEIYRRKTRHECEICRRQFNQIGHLQTHLRTHTGERPFECKTCKVRFKHKSHLKSHLRIHTGEKTFECEICQRQFYHAGNLKTHLRTHTGEKPFVREICEVKFIDKCHLKAHLNTHTGEKLFECEICKLRFKSKGNKKRHMSTHTGEKPFECDICKVRFPNKYNLKTHLRTHTGEKPFKCEICEVRFTHKGTLKTHLRTHNS